MRGQRQLEGAGHALEQQPRRLAAVLAPGARRAVDELVDQRGIEARRDDGDATLARVETGCAGEWSRSWAREYTGAYSAT